jgi:hypothetical protein
MDSEEDLTAFLASKYKRSGEAHARPQNKTQRSLSLLLSPSQA